MRFPLVVVIVCALAVVLPGAPGSRASADPSTPTLVTVTPDPDPTPVPPSPEGTAAEVVTVQPEPPTPTPTTAPLATEGPTPSPTVAAIHAGRPTAVPTATPVIAQAPSAPAVAPLPSPAELQLDARLRWGTRVPSAIRRWAFLIVPAAHKYGLSPNLVAAVMSMESGGDPLAWNSHSDARGLMQVLHGPWDPRENIDIGARMLAEFYAEFQDLTLALAAYDAGPHAILEYNGVPPYRETRDYVIVVRYLYDLFNHRKLTRKRRAQYRATLKDLQRFPDQRKKIQRLAQTAQVSVSLDLDCRHFQEACNQPKAIPIFSTLDPFWPIGEGPDPLQHVDPYARAGQRR